jgi:hypothetical protein
MQHEPRTIDHAVAAVARRNVVTGSMLRWYESWLAGL